MDIQKIFEKLQKEVRKSTYNDAITDLITELYSACLGYLGGYDQEKLISLVEGKEFFAFTDGKKHSRAINGGLYNPNTVNWDATIAKMKKGSFVPEDKDAIQSTLYSIAISFCASIDLLKERDQKTPGTFFEYFIAYFFTWRVGIAPQKSIKILNLDDETLSLPTDYIFNLGKDKQKFHMPVKTSSRERSIMLWAHQKLVNGIYGEGRFMGTPVLLAETKLDKRKREVVEICLPDQWKLYQYYIAKLTRIYYLDLPSSYMALNDLFPPIAVRDFADFFFEWNQLTPS